MFTRTYLQAFLLATFKALNSQKLSQEIFPRPEPLHVLTFLTALHHRRQAGGDTIEKARYFQEALNVLTDSPKKSRKMTTIALVDTRSELPGETIGTVISTHGTIAAAFKANEAFQSRMRASGVKSHIRTKIVTLKVRLGDGEHVRPSLHLA